MPTTTPSTRIKEEAARKEGLPQGERGENDSKKRSFGIERKGKNR